LCDNIFRVLPSSSYSIHLEELDKPPNRISISNDSDLRATIEDAAKVPTASNLSINSLRFIKRACVRTFGTGFVENEIQTILPGFIELG